ncbi:MAG: hypothetical protein AAFU61_02360 [Pseudomonadota bacterium]
MLALAGPAEVTEARAQRTGPAEGGAVWRFDVTLRHGDTGWDHYADAWEIRLPGGEVLGTRTLFHPHVEEQPFTRSLSGVTIPRGTAQVLIYPRDSVHGWGAPLTLDLPR